MKGCFFPGQMPTLSTTPWRNKRRIALRMGSLEGPWPVNGKASVLVSCIEHRERRRLKLEVAALISD
jgi:hypothetical protein